MNNCTLIGRLTKDPELRYTADNFPTCKFSIAIDRVGKTEKKTNFIPVKALGKTAENCARYLSKGRLVGVTGSIETGSYNKNGTTYYNWEVLAGSVEFLESKQKTDDVDSVRQQINDTLGIHVDVSDDIPF